MWGWKCFHLVEFRSTCSWRKPLHYWIDHKMWSGYLQNLSMATEKKGMGTHVCQWLDMLINKINKFKYDKLPTPWSILNSNCHFLQALKSNLHATTWREIHEVKPKHWNSKLISIIFKTIVHDHKCNACIIIPPIVQSPNCVHPHHHELVHLSFQDQWTL